MNFINLTNGIEWMEDIRVDGVVRIQSTWLEQKRWWPIIHDLDYAFLAAVASGHDVIVHDTSAHKKESRAIYQGIPWITYALSKAWLLPTYIPYVRSHNVHRYFHDCFYDPDAPLRQPALRRLKYISRIIEPSTINISGRCKPSDHDGDYVWFLNKLKGWNR